MSDRYSTPLSDEQARMFKNWSRVDPVSDYECHLNLRKAKLQGWDNPSVSLGCQGEADTGKGATSLTVTSEINNDTPVKKMDEPTSSGGKGDSLFSEGPESDDIF